MKMIFRATDKSCKEGKVGVGARFIKGDTEYILSQVGNGKVVLVNLYDGNRYEDPIEAEDPYLLSEEEFMQVSDGVDFVMIHGGRY